MKVRLIPNTEVKELISIEETIEAVGEAFRSKGEGKAQMPPKLYIFFEKFNGDFRVMPAYLQDMGAAGVKVVNAHPNNPHEKDMPAVMATVLLLNPETGTPLAIMDGTLITNLRTGAAGAIAAKYLANEGSSSVGMIGTGTQARTQLSALTEVFELNMVKAYSRTSEKRRRFTDQMAKKHNIKVKPVEEPKKAVENVDIIVTTTPSTSPVVFDDWISEGVHINAIGADAPEKQELDPKILKRSKIAVDEWKQASHSGEINVPLSQGIIAQADIFADICEIVSGKKKGRTSDKEITIFDSTGLAVQDVSTAWKVYEKAQEKNVGVEFDLL